MEARQITNRAPRILLVNLHSSCNAGDDALTQEALRQLDEQFAGAIYTLAINDPESYSGAGRAIGSFTSWVKPISLGSARANWRWTAFPGLLVHSVLALARYRLTGKSWYPLLPLERSELLAAYFEADMVVSAAGNFLYTSGRLGLPFLLSLYTIFYAYMAGKPFYTLPQTLGPISRWREKFLASQVLRRARLVMIRDSISAHVCKEWNINGLRWKLMPDLAFAQRTDSESDTARALLSEHGVAVGADSPLLGATVIHWGAQSRSFPGQAEYEDAVAAAIRAFLTRHGGKAILFSQVCGPTAAEDDRVPAARVHDKLKDLGDRVVLIESIVPAAMLRAAYGQMDIFMGTRLHSNIFALTEGVPVVAIGYQYKTKGIMRQLRLEQWVLDIDQTHGSQQLADLLCRAWLDRKAIIAQLSHALPDIRRQALQAGALIAADYRALCDR